MIITSTFAFFQAKINADHLSGGRREVPAIQARTRRGCRTDGKPCKSHIRVNLVLSNLLVNTSCRSQSRVFVDGHYYDVRSLNDLVEPVQVEPLRYDEIFAGN